MMNVGIASSRRLVSSSELASRATIVNFTISKGRLSPIHLMDSGSSSAGRYMCEILRRLQRHAPATGGYLVLNPRYEIIPQNVHKIIEAALATNRTLDCAVISDALGRLAATLFRRLVEEEDIRILNALSADDARLELLFLETMFGWKGELLTQDFDLGRVDRAGFPLGLYDRASQGLPATLAIEAMRAPQMSGLDLAQARRRLKQIAVMPYHAGDVLFLAQAIRAFPRIDAFVVFSAYAPIVRELLPDIEIIEMAGGIPNRDGNAEVCDEISFIARLLQQTRRRMRKEGRELDGIFYLMRQQRDYNASRFHLRQMFYFAIGADTETGVDFSPLSHVQKRLSSASSTRQVVLHFDGGWPLKGYPKAWRQPLIDLLVRGGFSPIILGPKDSELAGCDFKPFINLDSFKKLLAESTIFAGVDSFPAHFAGHHGVPTIHLFASTHPNNSEYGSSATTMTLSNQLGCVPCGHTTICKLDNGQACHNAAPPPVVFFNILKLASTTRDHALLAGIESSYEKVSPVVDEVKQANGLENGYSPSNCISQDQPIAIRRETA